MNFPICFIFWSRLISTETLSSKRYRLLLNLYNEGNHELIFVRHVENIFDSIGPSFIFSNQISVNVNWIKVNIKQILIDQFVQNWRSQIANSSRGNFYSMLNNIVCLEPYLLRVDQQHRNCITKFRVSNMKLPTETGRWYNISKDHRMCTKCSENLIGDEFYTIMAFLGGGHPELSTCEGSFPEVDIQNCQLVRVVFPRAGLWGLFSRGLALARGKTTLTSWQFWMSTD